MPQYDNPPMSEILTVDGKLTGKVRLYIDGATDGMDIGNLINGGSYAPENLYFANNSSVPYMTGTDIVLGRPKAAAIYGANGFEGYTETVKAAINACQGTDKIIVLQRKNSETNTVSKDVYIDLNGFRNVNMLTIKDGATVYLKDNSTDDLTGSFGYLEEVSGNVKAMDGYFLYTDEKGYISSHAYRLAINSVALRPSAAGIYFGGSFNISGSVPVLGSGIVVSVENPLPVADGSDASCLWSSGSTSVLVKNILGTDKDMVDNALCSTMLLYARAYVELSDGSFIYSNVVAVNLRQVVEVIDTNWDVLTDTQKESIDSMYRTFGETMDTWNIPNLKHYRNAF